jgi:hypothetical protein
MTAEGSSMKKLQHNFAVEYKSGRQKHDAEPNSISGNIDLKSVVCDVEEEAMPFLPDSPRRDQANKEVSSPKANRALPILTPPRSDVDNYRRYARDVDG